MESKTSSGQILIECALGLLTLAILFSALLEFNAPKIHHGFRKSPKQKEIKERQLLDFRSYKNER